MSAQNGDDEQGVRRLEEDLIKAFRGNDAASLASLMADDFVFTDPLGTSITKDRWLEDFASGAFAFESIETENVRVRLTGDAALVTGLVTLKARSRAGGYNGRFGVVDVYMKRWDASKSRSRRASTRSFRRANKRR